MNFSCMLAALLLCFSTAQAFSCPEDEHTFYHPDVSTGCQVYHKCENSQLTNLTCPSGQAFNIRTSSCEDASTVNCVETMDDHIHHLHKRAIEEVHMINIQDTKMKLVEVYDTIKPVLKELAKSILPSIYDKFQQKYLPAIRSIEQDFSPFFYGKVYPQIQKWSRYFFRIAGKLVEKAYRSYQLSDSTHIAVVSISDIADEVSNDLKPIISLGKYFSARMMANGNVRYVRQKRAIEEVHMINIQDTKMKLLEACDTLKPVLKELARSIFPSFYNKFQEDYLPVVRSIRQDFSPFFYGKVYPQIQKWSRYFFRIAGKLVEKAYRSYQLSDSTHIAVVSISDIVDEVSNDLKPVISLGKYLSTKMMDNVNVRYKREAGSHVRQKRQAPSFMFDLISPFVDSALRSVTDTLFGDSNTLLSKILLPTIYDFFGDKESRNDMLKIGVSAHSSFSPLLWQIMKENPVYTADGYIVQVPRPVFEKATKEFLQDTWPLLIKVLNKHLKPILYRMGDNVPLLTGAADQLVTSGYTSGQLLKDHIIDFMNKHKGLFRKSTSTHVKFYTIEEILQDLTPIKVTLFNLGVEYLRKNPQGWLNMFFGEGSFFQKRLMGSPVYAQPKPQSIRPTYSEPKPQTKRIVYAEPKPQTKRIVYAEPRPQNNQAVFAKSHLNGYY